LREANKEDVESRVGFAGPAIRLKRRRRMKMSAKTCLMVLVAVAVCLPIAGLQASVSTWNAGGGGANTWANTANWDVGVPAAGDTALFTGSTNHTVTIGAATAIDTINVSGSAQWVFAGTATLNVATAFNYGDSFTGANPSFWSQINGPVLSGGMSLDVSAGELDIIGTNSYTGGTYITGGILAVGRLNDDGFSSGALGTGNVYIGDTTPGDPATDAALYLANQWSGQETYAKNFVIQAGNSGKAIIGQWDSRAGGLNHTGTVTLNKDVTFLNNCRWDDIPIAANVGLYQSGAITGTGNVTFSGIGAGYFSGLNTYTGATNILGGYVYITGTASTNVGNFTVSGGDLFVASSASLGNASNTITLGALGNFGGLATYSGAMTLNRAITLAGNGGVIATRGNTGLDISGVISDTNGTQRLIFAQSGSPVGSADGYLDANNTFGGGLIVTDGVVDINGSANYNNTVYGSGNITIDQAGALYIRGANNVGANATVLVKRQGNSNLWLEGGILYLAADVMPAIDPASNGVIEMRNVSSTNVNAALGGTTPIGDGTMAIGGYNWTISGFSGTSLQALVANQTPADGSDPTIAAGSKTYYIRQCPNGINLDAPGVTGALTDLNGTVMNVQLGTQGGDSSWVKFDNNESFTGTLTIDRNTCLQACADTATASGLGAATGNIVLRGAIRWDWNLPGIGTETLSLVNNYGGAVAISKNNISYDGGVHLNMNDLNIAARTTYLTAASLTRVGNSTLAIQGVYSDIGTLERFLVTAAPAVTDNMVAPYYWNDKTYEFLTYDTVNTPSTGFNRVTATSTGVVSTIAGAGPTNIVYTAGETVSGTQEVYAIHTTGALTGGTVQVDSGGVIFTPNAAITCTTNFNFGANEAVLITPNNVATLSGTLTGSGGLTKAGVNALRLGANNSATLSGNVTINEGTLYAQGVAGTGNGGTINSLGSGSVVLDGGTLAVWDVNGGFFNTVLPNNIVLGTNGGTLHGFDGSSGNNNVYYTGNISGGAGSGPLYLDSCNGLTIQGTNNTYTGGTIIGNNTLNAYVAANSTLGTGDVVVIGGGNGYLNLNGNANINPQARLILQTWSASARFNTTAPVIGSLEGNGAVILGQGGGVSTLTLGGNNASTDFYGTIGDGARTAAFGNDTGAAATIGSVTKIGTGTFTMWGQNWYAGATTVNNGTVDNNGGILGAVNVTGVSGSTPIYGGTGTTAGLVTVNAGGTASGSGVFNAGLTLNGGGAATGSLTINGPVSVDSASTFSSNGPITGAVTTAGAFAGNANITGNVNVTGGTFGGNHTINGTFTSSAAVSGASTFNGAVTVSGGTFTGTHTIGGNYTQNGGALSGTSTFGTSGSPVAVTVNAGSFSGNHTINGSFTTTAGSNAVVAPHNGASSGTLTINGTVTLDHSTTLNFNLGAPGTTGSNDNDLINITGPLSLDGTLNVNNLGGFGVGTYTLIDYSGALSGAGLSLNTAPSGFNYAINTGTPDEINLVVSNQYVAGDTNHDGLLNELDIDAIYQNLTVAPASYIGTWPRPLQPYQAQYDVNGDGVVDQSDVTYELNHYFHTSYGDANLDRATDFGDFQTLLNHWQASGPTIGWTQADFNGDGVVDFLDFQILLNYWNPGGWNYAPSQTPEPASLTLILLGGLALLRRKK
jgi:autotransporter-associated beta strand protein